MANASGNYTVVVDGQKFNVTIAEGNANIQVTPVASAAPAAVVTPVAAPVVATPAPVAAQSYVGTPVPAAVNGAVWKILVNEGDRVEKDQQIMILEAMKMEIEIIAPVAGIVSKILVNTTDSVEDGQTLAFIS
jgi:pyruvate carboxylase subunit B